MTTLAARGSGTPTTTGTTWASVTNAVDGTAGTNPATYATMTNATASAVATIEVSGYDFAASIGASDTLNSVTVALRHLENNTGRFVSVRFQPYDGATAIGTLFTATMATAARTDSTTFPVTLAQLRSSTFKIRVTITGAASTQSRVFSIDQVDVTADYTITPPTITQAAYRFYADGTETGSTALAAQDTGHTVSVDPAESLLLSYSETNVDAQGTIGPASTIARGQSFMGNGQTLSRVGFWMSRLGTPVAGNIGAALYAHTGTFGTSGLGTGSPLATATTTKATSAFSTTAQWEYFTFDGTYTLTAGTPYVVVATGPAGGDSGNCVRVGMDTSAGTAPGNAVSYNGSAWNAGFDVAIELYTLSNGDVNLQVRMRLQSTTAVAVPATDDFQLQWERNTSGTWTTLGSAALADSYPETNYDAAIQLGDPILLIGQSFLGNGRKLVRVRFWMYKSNSPTDNLVAALYAHSGSFGSSSVATGSPLATATPVPASGVIGTSTTKDWQDCTFDGTFTLTAGTPYVFAVGRSGALDFTNAIFVGYDSASPTHAGNYVRFDPSTTMWGANNTRDLIFELYTDAGTVTPYASPNLTDAAATTNRLDAGSGSFVAGKVSEDGLVDDLGWTANNYTELLYSVTLKQADLTPADTLRFRVLRNGATTGLTYTQVPTITIGAAGPATVTGVAAVTVPVAVTATGTVIGIRTGTATVTLALATTATGVRVVDGTATASLAFATSAVGTVVGPTVIVTGTASSSLALTVNAVGTSFRIVTGTGAVAVALNVAATGIRRVAGVATASVAISATATGTSFHIVTGTATATVGLATTATGTRVVVGTSAVPVAITTTAVGHRLFTGTATATLALTVTATGASVTPGSGLGTVSLAFAVTAVGQRIVGGTATATVPLAVTATGVRVVRGIVTAPLALTVAAVGQVIAVGITTGTATATLAVTVSATGTVVEGAVTFGQWNGQDILGAMWGAQEVTGYLWPVV